MTIEVWGLRTESYHRDSSPNLGSVIVPFIDSGLETNNKLDEKMPELPSSALLHLLVVQNGGIDTPKLQHIH